MLDMTRYPSPVPAFRGEGFVPQGSWAISLEQGWCATGDPRLDATTLAPWWLSSLLDSTQNAAGAIQDWSGSRPGAVSLITAATTGSRRRLVGSKPVRASTCKALYLAADISYVNGTREVTLAIDNLENATGAVESSTAGVRLTWSSTTGRAVLGYNNPAAGAEQITNLLLPTSGPLVLGWFRETGFVGVWFQDQCLALRRLADINTSSGSAVVRPRVEIKATSDAVATVELSRLEFTAFVGGPTIGQLPAGTTPPADTTPPSAPASLQATSGSGQVALSWTAATDDVAVTGYRIYRDGALLASPTGTGTSYTDTTVTNGSTYSYAVRAIDAAGNESASSNAATGAPAAVSDTTKPSTPGTPVATAGPTSASVTTSGSTDNVGVTGYRWFRGGNQVGSTAGTTFTETGLPAGTAAGPWTVRAIDAAGNLSDASAASNTVTPTAASVIVRDTFTDTDGTLLTAHTGEVGATWSKVSGQSGDLTVDTGRIRTAAATSAMLIASAVAPSADYKAEVDMTFVTLATGVNAGVVARTGSGGSGYAMRYIASGSLWRLDRLASASGTSMASVASGVSAGQTKRVGIRVSGSTIVGTVDGVDVLTATSTDITAAGQAGLIANGASGTSSGIHLDNFLAQ